MLALRLKSTGDVARHDGAVGLHAALRPSFPFRLTTLARAAVALTLMPLMPLARLALAVLALRITMLMSMADYG